MKHRTTSNLKYVNNAGKWKDGGMVGVRGSGGKKKGVLGKEEKSGQSTFSYNEICPIFVLKRIKDTTSAAMKALFKFFSRDDVTITKETTRGLTIFKEDGYAGTNTSGWFNKTKIWNWLSGRGVVDRVDFIPGYNWGSRRGSCRGRRSGFGHHLFAGCWST
jgi:hypothetical protein